jgi:hypothetical protein
MDGSFTHYGIRITLMVRKKLTLCVGRSLAGALQTGFFALFDASIASQETTLAHRGT